MPNQPPVQPRSWSCPTARSDWAVKPPLVPIVSFFELVDGANELAGPAPALLAVRACDSLRVLPSAATTKSLGDSRKPAFLRKPERFVHPTGDPLDYFAASSGSTSSI